MKTKIIATIGPASTDAKVLHRMIDAGLDVCRLNFSHGDYADHLQVIDTIRQYNQANNTFISLLADLQGPKIRLGDLKEEPFLMQRGDQITITTKETEGTHKKVSIRYDDFAKDVQKGDQLLIDDGKLMLRVIESNGIDEVLLEAVNSGMIAPRKGVNLPDTRISQPSLTEKDLKDLQFILDQNVVNWIALSFVRSADDIIQLRKRILEHPCANKPRIIAKIEKPQALAVIEEIVNETDGIMIARGDLGVEIPMEQVPMAQKRMIKLCQKRGIPVIVATQMMEAMITSIRPTRAEVSDVANSVLDGADALMLSGETSVGTYPVETVATMQQIINQMEDYEEIYYKHIQPVNKLSGRFTSDSVLYAACDLAQRTLAKAIIVVTHTGYSALRLAAHRPKTKLYVFSSSQYLLAQMNLLWGVQGFYEDGLDEADKLMDRMNTILRGQHLIDKGDYIIHILSTPVWNQGASNTLRLGVVDE